MWAYIATESSEDAAARYVSDLRASCDRLRDFPLSGPARDQLRDGLRVISHHRHAIYYVVQEREVVIVRCLHGARDTLAFAERGGFED